MTTILEYWKEIIGFLGVVTAYFVGVKKDKAAYEDEPLRVTPNTDITKAVVWIGKIVDVPATEETEATFIDGYHVDVMLTETRDFGSAETLPKTPAHKFAVK